MLKLLKDKKGMNDVGMFLIIFLYLVFSSAVISIINSEFTGITTTINIDDLINRTTINDPIDDQNFISFAENNFWSIIEGMFRLNFLFGFGQFNLFIGLFNSVLNYTFIFLIARNIRGSGG